ncbi:ubiquitin carboxyl-terminal hydrolase 12-A-like [Notothenia coriiceps]|uniref:Ubiquitin carboxyl-terminal hydrolase 12-A-like n=1 Tax=Notothenia coriiceps TaxID=8208 RepID=A0A6I9NHL9_9TELE|nr:PREDICTED: ubiquitin carboxyl-terminal hydrolase 12-A-like [Notothenia coriiceps]
MYLFYIHQFFSNMCPPPAIKFNGLVNQGSTCYLNSVLQVLFMTKDFREAVERHTSDNPDTENIDLQLESLFGDLKSESANTLKITKKLCIKNVYEQQDAAECFEKILAKTSDGSSQVFLRTADT